MRTRWLTFGLLLLNAMASRGGELLDRIVANVNGHVILQSDWEDELRYECFMAARPLDFLSSASGKAALDRLIEQELIAEQMRASEIRPPTAEEINQQLKEIEDGYVGNKNAQAWKTALSEYDLTEDVIREHVALELTQLRLIDARLRPSIQIDAAAVEDYYKNQFLPELVGANAKKISLQQATPKIREILTQQQVNQMLGSWIESLRSQAQIQWFVSNLPEHLPENRGHAQ